jgi:Fis family transcriptional regulator, factor for inversion stimulation protein
MTVRAQLDNLIREMVQGGISYEDARREFERRYIQCALECDHGSITRAADRIGMHRNTLSRKMIEYHLSKK